MKIDVINNRYLLFVGSYYYPSGGWEDFEDSFEKIEDAVECAAKIGPHDWWHIVDLETQEIITCK